MSRVVLPHSTGVLRIPNHGQLESSWKLPLNILNIPCSLITSWPSSDIGIRSSRWSGPSSGSVCAANEYIRKAADMIKDKEHFLYEMTLNEMCSVLGMGRKETIFIMANYDAVWEEAMMIQSSVQLISDSMTSTDLINKWPRVWENKTKQWLD